jgi:hypothetical protein
MATSYDPIVVVNAITELNETIKKTNAETNRQNKIMIVLTVAIVLLTFVMVMPIISGYATKKAQEDKDPLNLFNNKPQVTVESNTASDPLDLFTDSEEKEATE